jgi:hypothetical protein
MPSSDRSRSRDVHVAMPGRTDRLTGALQGAFHRDRNLPDDMYALLCELDRKTGGQA